MLVYSTYDIRWGTLDGLEDFLKEEYDNPESFRWLKPLVEVTHDMIREHGKNNKLRVARIRKDGNEYKLITQLWKIKKYSA